MTQHRLATFFLLTYGLSWGSPGLALLWSARTGAFEVSVGGYPLLPYVVIWASVLSASTIIGLAQGGVGIRAYAMRLLRWQGEWA